jgi:hypothetical protein
MGMLVGVVRRRCLARAWPIPRDEGVTRAQAMEGGRMRRLEGLGGGVG